MSRSSPVRSLRRRIVTGILGITALAVLLFALPLAVAVGRLDRAQALTDLERDATRITALVPDNPVSTTRAVRLPEPLGSTTLVGIYTTEGQLAGGRGPSGSPTARTAQDGRVHQGVEGGQLTVAVPVPSDGQIVAVVRAATPVAAVTSRSRRSWAAMGFLGLLVLAVAAVLARRQARRIAVPLERLTVAARALGEGNFAIAPERSGILEADAAGSALRDTAARIGDLLERERAFSADASHQLRTPLTGLLLGMESALGRPQADLRAALDEALERARRLQATVDDLLSLRRDATGQPGSVDLEMELSASAKHWQPAFGARHRRLAMHITASLPAATASAAALRQVLDVLLDNALQHGAGAVTLSAVELGDAVAVEVTDEGGGLAGNSESAFTRRSPSARGHGIGLALARSLAEADGGRLVVRRSAPHPIFVLLLPAADTVLAAPAKAHSQASSS